MSAPNRKSPRRTGRRALAWVVPLSLLAVPGCAQLAGRAAGEAVEQPLRQMTEEENLENLERVMTSPQMARSARELSEAAAAGIVAGLTGPDSQQAVADLITQSGSAIETDLGPAVSSMVRRTIDETMTEFLSEERQTSFNRLASQVGGAITASMMRELGQGLENDVMPAMIRSFEDQVSPALVRELRDPELREAVGTVARELAYQAVLGTNEGIVDLAAGERVVGADDLGFPGSRMTLSWAALVALIAGLGVALVAMVVMLAKGASQRRHLEEDSRRREAMFMGLVQATLMHDATPNERREMMEQLRVSTVDFESGADAPASEPPTEEAPGGWWRRLSWR
jgi:hypothetical protein